VLLCLLAHGSASAWACCAPIPGAGSRDGVDLGRSTTRIALALLAFLPLARRPGASAVKLAAACANHSPGCFHPLVGKPLGPAPAATPPVPTASCELFP